jgi:hypothetical protein
MGRRRAREDPEDGPDVDDLCGGVGHQIKQRGEERLGAESPPTIADCPHTQRGRRSRAPWRTKAPRRQAGRQLDELIAWSHCAAPRGGASRGGPAGAGDPMALARGISQLMVQRVRRELAIEDDE